MTAKLHENLTACGSSHYITAENFEGEKFLGFVAVCESFLFKIWEGGGWNLLVAQASKQAILKVFSAKIAFSPICRSIIPENCLYKQYICMVCVYSIYAFLA